MYLYCLELETCLKSQASDRMSGLQSLKVWLKINYTLFIHSSHQTDPQVQKLRHKMIRCFT